MLLNWAGWLIEIDRYYSSGETRYFRPEISDLPVIIKEPEDANDTQIPIFIDNEYNSIAKSLEINWIDIGENETQGIWPLVGDDITIGGRNHDKNLKCVDAVAKLKMNYIKRVEWMNTNINSW